MPRWFEALLAAVLLLFICPIFVFIAAVLFVTDGSPVLFRQQRIGLHGHPFTLLKFRTMRASGSGPSITVVGDSRITPIGKMLRSTKLDELPQLFNVLLGEMSFVGPRPEVPEFVSLYDANQRRVLESRPGITDPASLAYHNEAELMAGAKDWREFYVIRILPDKLRLSQEYLDRRTSWSDFQIIWQTVATLLKSRLFKKH